MKKATVTLLAGLCAISFARAPQSMDIVDTAMAAPNFKTLVSLVKQAGLVETLKGDGPFTVLAPTDAAFAKLPKSLVKTLTSDKALLKKVLTYHVIPGKVMAADASTMYAGTVEGEGINVRIKRGKPTFNSANVAMADVMTSNGVIHAIDKVLLPPSVMKMMNMSKMKMKGGMMKMDPM